MRAIGGRCKDNPPDSYGASPLYTKGPIKSSVCRALQIVIHRWMHKNKDSTPKSISGGYGIGPTVW